MRNTLDTILKFELSLNRTTMQDMFGQEGEVLWKEYKTKHNYKPMNLYASLTDEQKDIFATHIEKHSPEK